MHQFNQQGSAEWLTSAFIYTVGAVAVVLVVACLLFVDKGLVRRRNVLDTTIQKIEDLKGKLVAVTRGTDPHIFLVRALLSKHLTEKDIVSLRKLAVRQ